MKIKVIEAMSAGLPVLTNEIGIEGIPAKDSEEYFFCTTPEEYEKRIIELANDEKTGRRIGVKAKEFIKNTFNYENDANILYSKILELVR